MTDNEIQSPNIDHGKTRGELLDQLESELSGDYQPTNIDGTLTSADYQLLDASEIWWVEAEAEAAIATRGIIYSGSVNRRLSDIEKSYIRDVYGSTNFSFEYNMVRLVAETREHFEPLNEDEIVPYSYAIEPNHQFLHIGSGQLRRIGMLGGRDILLLRVDTETYIDKERRPATRYTPNSVALLGFLSKVLSHYADYHSSLGLVTTLDRNVNVSEVKGLLGCDRELSLSKVGIEAVKTVINRSPRASTTVQHLAELTHVNEQVALRT
jgi:hypothetical protein